MSYGSRKSFGTASSFESEKIRWKPRRLGARQRARHITKTKWKVVRSRPSLLQRSRAERKMSDISMQIKKKKCLDCCPFHYDCFLIIFLDSLGFGDIYRFDCHSISSTFYLSKSVLISPQNRQKMTLHFFNSLIKIPCLIVFFSKVETNKSLHRENLHFFKFFNILLKNVI